jgi:type I restriction enzyme, S subunit
VNSFRTLQSYSLEDCMSAIIDYRGKTPRKTDHGVPLITARIVKGGRIETPNEFVDPLEYDDWMRRGMPKVGDVLITTEAPLGEVAQLTDQRVALAQRLILLRGNPEILDNSYLKYLLMSDGVQAQLQGRASGTTVFGIKQSELRKINLELPSIDEQRDIVAVIGAIDQKIEQNRTAAKILEALAEAIFRAWFVDFDPVKAKAAGATSFPSMSQTTFDFLPSSIGKISDDVLPEGWMYKAATDVAEIAIGKTPPRKEPEWFTQDGADVPWASIKDMGVSGVFIAQTSEFLTRASLTKFRIKKIPAKSVLVSFKLTLGRVAIADCEMTSNEAIAHFVPYEEDQIGHEFLYCYLSCFDYSRLGSTSSIATATNSKVVKGMPIIDPGREISSAFTETVRPLFEKIRCSQKEARALIKMRDYLLPKLISGEVCVKMAGMEV